MPRVPADLQADPGAPALLLRGESFGGILFDPADGTFLELDLDGYRFVRGWLAEQQQARTDGERAFQASVIAEIPSLADGPRPCRLIDLRPLAQAYPHAAVFSSPTLIDVQVTRRCNMGCPHCYASSQPGAEHMAFDDLQSLLEQASRAGVCQMAIGGGEPLLHPRLVDILELSSALGIVPNLTTSGDGMTPRILEAMAQCCGAVALSLEGVGPDFALRRRSGFRFFESSRARLREHGIPTVLQVTLSAENLPALPSIVDYCLAIPDLYGVIFLAYKPVGRGQAYHRSLSSVDPAVLYPQLRDAFLRLSAHTRVGYDCCMTPAITGIDVELGFEDQHLLEGCSAARTSVGITTGLDVVPCTFATHLPLGNLRTQSFEEIWHGQAAAAFRKKLDEHAEGRDACRQCPSRSSCLGGCPEWDLVGCTRASAGPGSRA